MTDCASGFSVVDCAAGVPDCCALDQHGLPADLTCSVYNGKFVDPGQQTWLLTVAFSTMALMSFGIGANDAANSWGTSVGSGAVTLTQAVVTGGLMDWLGATLLGSGAAAHMLCIAYKHTTAPSLGQWLDSRGAQVDPICCRGIRHHSERV